MATEADIVLRQKHVDWIKSQPYDFDIAASWHLPMSYKAAYRAYDDVALSSCLREYFNWLDQKIFRKAFQRKNVRLPRVIVLEHGDNVGWHAHGAISTQTGKLSQEEVIQLIKTGWLKHLRQFRRGAFADRLVWAELRHGSYVEYIQKEISTKDWEHSAKFDYVNCHFAA